MKVPDRFLKITRVRKDFLSKTQNSKAIMDRYMMFEYIIIKHFFKCQKEQFHQQSQITNTTLENIVVMQMTHEGSFNHSMKNSYESMRKKSIIQ